MSEKIKLEFEPEHFEAYLEQLGYAKVIQCIGCEHWDVNDGTFPDFDGKEWHKCERLKRFKDADGKSPMTVSWHHCRGAERRDK